MGGNPEHDYGAVILRTPFPGLAGFFRYADIAAVGQQPRLSGYPGDCDEAQCYDDDLITEVAARIVSYEIDTYGGQSGSPVWYPPASADPAVLAIHTRGVGDPACNPGDNCGTRVEATVMANFAFWIALNMHAVGVGGIAQLPDVSGASSPPYVALAVAAAVALAMITASGWYARRRLS